VEGYYKGWISRKAKECERNTVKGYRWAFVRYILPALGTDFLPNINADTLRDLRDSMDNLTVKGKKNVLDAFRVMLRDAYEAGFVPRVPKFPGFKSGKNKLADINTRPVEWISDADQWRIIEHIAVEDRPIFIFMKLSGARPGEARALQKSDIRWDDGFIVFRRAFGENQSDLKGTKTDPRTFPLSENLRWLLESMPKTLSPWVFLYSKTGKPYTKNLARDLWNPACSAAGAGYIPMNAAFRHSFVSQLVEAGTPSQVVQRLAGHTNPQTTQRYTHHNQSALATVLDRVHRIPGGHDNLDATRKKG